MNDQNQTNDQINISTTNDAADQPAVSNVWVDYITPFATEIGKSVVEINAAFQNLVGEVGEQAITYLQNEELTPFDDIKALLPEVPLARLRNAVSKLRAKPVMEQTADSAQTFEILPTVPTDESFIAMLKVGGELKIDTLAVTSAIRVALASGIGLYKLPKLISEQMESHADSLEQPAPDDFYKLVDEITKRNNAEIFTALKGAGKFVTDKKRTEFLNLINTNLWSSLLKFNGQLGSWAENWRHQATDPSLLMSVMVGREATAGALPPGLNQPPDTNVLQTAAESVINQINKIFAGTKIPVGRALAYEAQNIKAHLANPLLPSYMGYANKDQMIKALGVAIDSDYVRLEASITQFALGIVNFPNVVGNPDSEIAYCSALFRLGNNIPWESLPVAGVNRRRDRSDYRIPRGDE